MTARAVAPNRNLTLAASIFLAVDGLALLATGLWLKQLVAGLCGAILLLAAGLVLVYWRWHQRQLAEITAARAVLRAEAEALRELLGGP